MVEDKSLLESAYTNAINKTGCNIIYINFFLDLPLEMLHVRFYIQDFKPI